MNLVVIEFLLLVVPLLGLAIWEYLKVSRELRESSKPDDREQS